MMALSCVAIICSVDGVPLPPGSTRYDLLPTSRTRLVCSKHYILSPTALQAFGP